jgi:hypothetical protein
MESTATDATVAATSKPTKTLTSFRRMVTLMSTMVVIGRTRSQYFVPWNGMPATHGVADRHDIPNKRVLACKAGDTDRLIHVILSEAKDLLYAKTSRSFASLRMTV